jgi:cell division protein FtsW
MSCYLFLLIRILIAAKKATTIFATLLIIGVGIPIIVQAIINMAVAVNLFPVTGQTLPLISSGGTSIWMTCIAIGIILSVTANKEKEVSADNEENPLDVLHEAIG